MSTLQVAASVLAACGVVAGVYGAVLLAALTCQHRSPSDSGRSRPIHAQTPPKTTR